MKIDGKPVVFIYLTRVYFHNRGLKPLADLRAKHPNVYLIGDDVFGRGYRKQDAKLWDAITAYDVYGQSLQRHGPTRKSLQLLKKTFEEAQSIAHDVGTAFRSCRSALGSMTEPYGMVMLEACEFSPTMRIPRRAICCVR